MSVLLILSLLAVGPAAPNDQGAEAEIRELMKAIDLAHQRADAAAFNRIWAPDYVITDFHGAVKERAEALAEWKAGAHGYLSYQSDDIKVRLHGDTAIVTARVTRTSRTDPTNVGRFRHTRVFVKLHGAWRLAATHVTRIADQ